MPMGLKKNLSTKHESHASLIGWVADKFPIYGPNGYGINNELDLITNKSSYQLKAGNRVNKNKTLVLFIMEYLYTTI